MKINSVQLLQTNNIVKKQALNSNINNNLNFSSTQFFNYPKDYYINFTAKRNVGEVYKQHEELVPRTVKNYIDNNPNCENKELDDIHKEVFEDLLDCKTAEDVRKKFETECNEGQWKRLKNFSEADYSHLHKGNVKDLIENLSKAYDKDKAGCDLTVLILRNFYHDGCKKMNVFMGDILPRYLNKSDEANKIKEIIEEATDKRKVDYFRSIIDLVGIDLPNWIQYGKSLANYKHKVSNEKARYTMIDTWNHCEDLRDELSLFLIFNHKTSNNDLFEPTSVIDSLTSTEFWNTVPENLKTQFMEERKKANENYEQQQAKSKNEFDRYKANLEAISKTIREEIQEINRELINQDYPFASKFIFQLEEKINPFSNKSITRKDLYKVLLKQFTNKELDIIEHKDSSSPEFKNLLQIISKKLEQIKKDPDFYNIANSEKMATEEYSNMSEKTKKEIKAKYNDYQDNTSNSEDKETILNILIKNAEIKDKDIDTLKEFISHQGKYILNILSNDNELSLHTQKLVLDSFNQCAGTNYQNEVIVKQQRLNTIKNVADELMNSIFDFI